MLWAIIWGEVECFKYIGPKVTKHRKMGDVVLSRVNEVGKMFRGMKRV